MAEYQVRSGSGSPGFFANGFGLPYGGGLSTKTVDRSAPSGDNPRVVIFNEIGGAGVEVDPSGLSASEFSAAITAAKFGRPVTPAEFKAPSLVNSTSTGIEPQPSPPTSSPLAIPTSPLPITSQVSPAPPVREAMSDSINVQFERNNGDTLVASYSAVIDDGQFLTLVYDHNAKPGVLYRPGASEDPIYISVEANNNKPEKVYSCYPTGYKVRFNNYELIAFVIEQDKNV